jgi:hypothetical protein
VLVRQRCSVVCWGGQGSSATTVGEVSLGFDPTHLLARRAPLPPLGETACGQAFGSRPHLTREIQLSEQQRSLDDATRSKQTKTMLPVAQTGGHEAQFHQWRYTHLSAAGQEGGHQEGAADEKKELHPVARHLRTIDRRDDQLWSDSPGHVSGEQ